MSASKECPVIGMIFIVLICLFSSAAHSAGTHPDEVVKSGLAKLEDAARAHNNQRARGEEELAGAVRLFMQEYTDVRYAARLIFASYWEAATPEQRDRFVNAFGNQVTKLLVQFIPDVDFETIRIEPYLGDTEEIPLMIRVTFQTTDMQTIHFVLVIHKRNGRWLVFDVVAEGVSYIKTYRYQFTSEIADTGIEAMIERFEIKSSWRKDDQD